MGRFTRFHNFIRILFSRTTDSEKVRARLKRENMYYGLFVGPFCIFFSVLGFFILQSAKRSAELTGEEFMSLTDYALSLTGLILFLVSAACYILVAVLYLKEKIGKTSFLTNLTLAFFSLSSIIYGIFNYAGDVFLWRKLTGLVGILVMVTCILVQKPMWSLLLICVSLGSFRVSEGLLYDNPYIGLRTNLMIGAILWIASVTKYLRTRDAAIRFEAVEKMSVTDELTGLHNRHCLKLDVEHFVGENLVAIMFDVDHFKQYNDTYGHAGGDAVLKRFAECLEYFFGFDATYRYGGDEFLVMIRPGVGLPNVESLLKAWDEEDRSLTLDGENVTFSNSSGYTYGKPATVEEVESMIQRADVLLYEAKRNGKGFAVGEAFVSGTDRSLEKHVVGKVFHVVDVDPLTGLPNVSRFRNYAQEVFTAEKEEDKRFYAMVYFDLINFTAFNRRYCFQAGDELLQITANKIREFFPDYMVSRLNDDHFVTLADKEGLEEKLIRLHDEMKQYQRDVLVDLKAGIYVTLSGNEEVGVVMDLAKAACVSIKKTFDRHYRFYDSLLQEKALQKEYVVNHLQSAIEQDHIVPFYQPVVRTTTGVICGCEALARWLDPELGMISPGDFIPILEEIHMIHKLDLHIVEDVCHDIRKALDAGLKVSPISINLSRLDFQLCDAFAEVEAIRKKYNVHPRMLHVEVTESAMNDDTGYMNEVLDKFREAQYEIWMDDFGSDYSSLNSLQDYEVDTLKLDMKFLKNFEKNAKSGIIIESVVDMAKRLEINTLTEGVETRAQSEFLKRIGCEKMQGFLFYKPMSAKEMWERSVNGEFVQEDGMASIESSQPNLL
ncbi:MAG: EAL domain-containing protein [Lachnospiraceae bacterium]|nr:EAL domain-containing protein [Lachnospiraceae bacterium]